PYNDLAWTECGLKQYYNAIKNADYSIRLNPRSSAAFDTRGYAYWHVGKVNEALADFQQAIKLAPKDGAAPYHRRKMTKDLNVAQQPDATATADAKQVAQYTPDAWEN